MDERRVVKRVFGGLVLLSAAFFAGYLWAIFEIYGLEIP